MQTPRGKYGGASDIENIDHEPLGALSSSHLFTMDTLIRPTQGIGKWYREAVNTVCDMTVRLPRPIFFGDSFKRSTKRWTRIILLWSFKWNDF